MSSAIHPGFSGYWHPPGCAQLGPGHYRHPAGQPFTSCHYPVLSVYFFEEEVNFFSLKELCCYSKFFIPATISVIIFIKI
jgi:hypothetical protein